MDGKASLAKARFLALLLLLLAPACAGAAQVELTGMIAYSTSNFGDGYHSLVRRYTGAIDFKFTPVSAFEIEYTSALTQYAYPSDLGGVLKNKIKQETTYRDTIYSFNWVQNLVSTKWIIQPYFIIGGGKLHRQYTVQLPDIPFSQDSTQNVITGTGGFGLRLFLTKSMALKAEGKTYVPNFQFAKWKDDQALSVGLSWTF